MNYKSTLGTGNEGLYWLGRIREQDPAATVIMITAHGEINTAVRALKAGASDFSVKSQAEARVERYRRLPSGAWEYSDVTSGTVELCTGAVLDLTLLYDGLPA